MAPAATSPRSTFWYDATPALAMALLATLLRVIYLRFVCDYQLVEDEAHYWLWSQYLDWSYYSKGPGVAWAIAASTRIFGNHEWGVRLPTAVLSGAGLASVGLMLVAMARDAQSASHASPHIFATPARVGMLGVVGILLAPALQAIGVLMTIDGPYTACWALAALCAYFAIVRHRRWAWPALGLALAAGFLFKYTMALLVPGLLLFAVLNRTKRPERTVAPWPYVILCVLLALTGLIPVLMWNASHDWVTVRHLLGHLGLRAGDVPVNAATATDDWSPFWTLELIAQQLGIIGPLLVLGVWGGVRSIRARRAQASPRPRASAELLLICCGAPILVFYLCVALITEPEGNWPMAAYVTLIPLGAWAAADALAEKRAARARGAHPDYSQRPFRWLWRAGVWYGLISALLVHFAGDVTSSLNRLSTTAPFRAAFESVVGRPPRPIVLGRLYGARDISREVAATLGLLDPADPAGPPLVLAQHYGRASQVAYYFERDPEILKWRAAHSPPRASPEVFCAMPHTGGRKSQFDLWPHSSLSRPDLLGRSAIILSNNRPETLAVWRKMFLTLEPPNGLRLEGEHKPDRYAYIARGYRGETAPLPPSATSTPLRSPATP